MRIAIGADHAGFPYKEQLRPYLAGLGHEVLDLGAASATTCDYPDYAFAVGEAVGSGRAQRGVLICGSGIGMAVAANKIPGSRAAVVLDKVSAEMSRRHNDTNVVCFGARVQTIDDVKSLLKLWLDTPYDGGRHEARLVKIKQVDEKCRSEAKGGT